MIPSGWEIRDRSEGRAGPDTAVRIRGIGASVISLGKLRISYATIVAGSPFRNPSPVFFSTRAGTRVRQLLALTTIVARGSPTMIGRGRPDS